MYLGVIFDTSGTDDKEIRSRVLQARKYIAGLSGILWIKDTRNERKLNIYNALIKSSLFIIIYCIWLRNMETHRK
jgi:hypothetical protein